MGKNVFRMDFLSLVFASTANVGNNKDDFIGGNSDQPSPNTSLPQCVLTSNNEMDIGGLDMLFIFEVTV